MRPEWYAVFAEQYIKDGGHAVFSECRTCGHLKWMSTDLGKPKGFSFVPSSVACDKCEEVIQRSPEIALWVVSVVAKQIRDAMTPNDSHERREL